MTENSTNEAYLGVQLTLENGVTVWTGSNAGFPFMELPSRVKSIDFLCSIDGIVHRVEAVIPKITPLK